MSQERVFASESQARFSVMAALIAYFQVDSEKLPLRVILIGLYIDLNPLPKHQAVLAFHRDAELDCLLVPFGG